VPSGFPDYEYFEIPLPVAQGGTGLTQWDGARVYKTATYTLTTGVAYVVAFDAERYDNGDLHDTVTNPSRLTAQKAGKYLITGSVEFGESPTGTRIVGIRLGGSTYIAFQKVLADSTTLTRLTLSTIYHLAAGDYVELVVQQNSGGNLWLTAAPAYSPEFAMQWVGP